MTTKQYPLAHGMGAIPAIGLGTWQSRDAVKHALQSGYKDIDTALNCGNEKAVGEGICDSGIPSEDIWVTTKLNNHWHHHVAEVLDSSLANLGLDYVALYLVHFPCSTDPGYRSKHLENRDFVRTWQEMQKLLGTGTVRNIGLSNFQVTHLKLLLSDPSYKVIPAVNQIELQPYNPSDSPINGQTNILHDPIVLRIAGPWKKTPAQIVLMWNLQRGVGVIPKSVTPARIEDNFALDGWALTEEVLDEISAIKTRAKVLDICKTTYLKA
ncbi:NADP-dependent oxidoreductase domain-containing protein [Aspergillus undulatus]|uniref:NADP-dependent oxidoreductase domain-containing protein n=1 Tax=Aspergillus undulatus TaxID=1810928 RepID=UPI003CCD59F2